MYVFGVVGFEFGPTPVPAGESMLSKVSVSPLPAANVAVIFDDCPTSTVGPSDEVIVVAGVGGGVTVSVAGHVPVPPVPTAVPE